MRTTEAIFVEGWQAGRLVGMTLNGFHFYCKEENWLTLSGGAMQKVIIHSFSLHIEEFLISGQFSHRYDFEVGHHIHAGQFFYYSREDEPQHRFTYDANLFWYGPQLFPLLKEVTLSSKTSIKNYPSVQSRVAMALKQHVKNEHKYTHETN